MATETSNSLDPAVARLIRNKARRLVGRHGYTRANRSDLEQELSLHVIRAFAAYEPNRSRPGTFANRVIENKVVDFIRHAQRQPPLQPLGDGFDIPVDSAAADRAELILDVQEAVARLPPQLHEVALLFMDANEAEVARRNGYSRQRVRRLRSELARHLRSLDPGRCRGRTRLISTSRTTLRSTA